MKSSPRPRGRASAAGSVSGPWSGRSATGEQLCSFGPGVAHRCAASRLALRATGKAPLSLSATMAFFEPLEVGRDEINHESMPGRIVDTLQSADGRLLRRLDSLAEEEGFEPSVPVG